MIAPRWLREFRKHGRRRWVAGPEVTAADYNTNITSVHYGWDR